VISFGYCNWTARLRLVLVLAVIFTAFVLVMKQTVAAAPLEEDLPVTPVPHVAQLRAGAPSGGEADQTDSPADGDSASAGDSANGDSAAVAASSAAPRHMATFFPYTIRPGDTLNSIASIFGLDSSDLARVNHITDETGLIAGHSLRIPNPFLARQRELEAEIDRLSAERQETAERAHGTQERLDNVQSQIDDLNLRDHELRHESASLPWWRAATYMAAAAALLMFGTMAVALVEWLKLRGRFRAVAEMNESLRRLDYRYRNTVAKAELRLQELYGRRRRGIEDGQERPRIAEDAELEHLHQQLKEILEAHLARLGPPGQRARRARWRELIGGIGAPAEARSARR